MPASSKADEPEGERAKPTSHLRGYASFAVLVLVLAGVGYTIAKNRRSFADSLARVGIGGLLLSLVFGVIGVLGTAFEWRAVLAGLGVEFGTRDGLRVFFVSQLGKYLPGSVWPIVMQMEAGRARGANRKSMIAANLVTVLLSVASGVVVAAVLLPFSYPAALHRFWWALAALPLVLVLVHPRSLPFLMDHLLRLLRRQPLEVRMTTAATVKASAWSLVSWLGLGLHITVLVAAIGKPSFTVLALSIGGICLAVSAGVLFIPSPAGAGPREFVLGFVLVAVLSSGQALAVVVASRVLLIAADLLCALVAWLAGGPRTMGTHDQPVLAGGS